MTAVKPRLRDIQSAVFRANLCYELILFDRLDPSQQAMLADLKKDPELYGILRPRDDVRLSMKSVCRDTALLFLTLQQPGTLPEYVRLGFGAEANQTVAQLVLDGVLELRCPNGDYVAGPQAYEWIYEADQASTPGSGLARLSLDALHYAQSLAIEDAAKLSARLYFYNREAASPRWFRRLPNSAAVARWLGLEPDGTASRLLRGGWTELPLSTESDGWRLWGKRVERHMLRNRALNYKLYLSPRCEEMPQVLPLAIEAFRHATRFKIGRDIFGLLRPDKIVAYFESFAAVEETARELGEKLQGCEPHGVPFTAELANSTLLSWGMDPPRDPGVLKWQQGSWRMWVTDRLALALVAARGAPNKSIGPIPFALQRLSLEGVDTATWTPAHNIWPRET
jgi:hypothetical protein